MAAALASLADKIRKATLIYSGAQPRWDEHEAAKANERRILQVIWARWVALGMLIGYGALLYVFYSLDTEVELTSKQWTLPVAAMLFVALYNSWYHLTYKWWVKIRLTNDLQVLFDLLVITVLVHFSGGVHSWFWTMYLLLVLEAAFLLERDVEVWIVGLVASLLHGGLITAEYYDIIDSAQMPFASHELAHTLTYTMIVWGWVLMMNVATVVVATHFMGMIRRREKRLRDATVRDELTGLYNVRHFTHCLQSEISRSTRFGREFSLVVLDLDGFKEFNARCGHDCGDLVLAALGGVIGASVRHDAGTPGGDVDLASRCGGEMFAVIMPETQMEEAVVSAERLRQVIEKTLRRDAADYFKICALDVELLGIFTATFGVSTFPEHGRTPQELMHAATEAVTRAKEAGKNRVARAEGLGDGHPQTA